MMDIVIPLMIRENNPDLKFCLRTINKNMIDFDGKIYFSGSWKPSWVNDEVTVIENRQNRGKWLNALNNVIAACKNPSVSEDFILFNDDFFCIKKVYVNKPEEWNYCRGTLNDKIQMFEDKFPDSKSIWKRSFRAVRDLLIEIGAKHFLDFALHQPMIINKNKFLAMMELPAVKQYLKGNFILSFRSLYGNLYFQNPKIIADCKITPGTDYDSKNFKHTKWLSVGDNMIDNPEYPNLAKLVKRFPKSKYEY